MDSERAYVELCSDRMLLRLRCRKAQARIEVFKIDSGAAKELMATFECPRSSLEDVIQGGGIEVPMNEAFLLLRAASPDVWIIASVPQMGFSESCLIRRDHVEKALAALRSISATN